MAKKKPTELYPDPELYLGYDRPPPKTRRKLVRLTVSETASSSNEDIEGRPHKLNCNFTVIPCFKQQYIIYIYIKKTLQTLGFCLSTSYCTC